MLRRGSDTLTGAIARTCRRSSRGFTLIELLVVIVILGVISSVVVFAVRGAGDKGKEAADDADRRTLRTAQEAFCARYGRYASSEAQLVNPKLADPSFDSKGFLSNESESHDIRPATGTEPTPCNGTGYVIEEDGSDDDDEDGPDEEPGPGTFALAPPPPFGDREVGSLVALADGKILAYAVSGFELTTKAAIFDPALMLWTPATPPPALAEPTDALGVLLADDPATAANECGLRCGHVLVHAYTEWLRFNPAGTGSWENVLAPAYSKGSFVVYGAIPLVDDATTQLVECGEICGKVFLTSYEQDNPVADLYDPLTDTFQPIAYPTGLERQIASSRSVTRLKDGRVLMFGHDYISAEDRLVNIAFIFDPITRLFTEAATPVAVRKVDSEDKTALLPNGDVLFLPDDVFRPAPRGSGGRGTWTKTGECSVGTNERCAFLGAFPDGTVVSHVLDGDAVDGSWTDGVPTGQTRRFNPGALTWTRSDDLLSTESAHGARTLGGHRAWAFLEHGCGTNCGKVLIARKTAELYTR